MPEANRAVLVCDAGERNALTHIQVAAKESLVAVVTVNRAVGLFHYLLQLRLQTLVRFQIVGRITQNNFSVAIDADAVVRVRQIFRSQPEIERVLGHQFQGEIRRDGRGTGPQGNCVELAHERYVAHRVRKVVRTEVEVIHAKCLLKDGRIRALGNRHHHRVRVAHVVTTDRVRAVG